MKITKTTNNFNKYVNKYIYNDNKYIYSRYYIMGKHLMYNAILNELKDVPGWELRLDERGHYLFNHFNFGNKAEDSFLKAKRFVDKVSIIAENHNHHPDITFGWGYCDIILLTHSYKGLTLLDFEIAKELTDLYEKNN
jgi:4a-hydroxytetrahydrobiopterin dehydratase